VTGTTAKCSFLAEISVSSRQFQESGVLCVECPLCGARRTFKSPKDRPHFPPHQRRKSPPRNRALPVYGVVSGFFSGLAITWLVDLAAGLYNGLFCCVIFASLGLLDTEIRPAEVTSWSWAPIRRNAVKFLGAGMVLGLAYGLLTGLYWEVKQYPAMPGLRVFIPCLLFGLSLGLVLGLLIVLTAWRL
jgi:hypothetical protein